MTDPVIICICLRTTNRHFCDQGNVHHPTSKLLKCDLVQTLNTFRNPSLRVVVASKASLVYVLSWFQRFCLWVQSWKIWNGVSSSELQNKQRDRNTISNLSNILLKNKILCNCSYWNTLKFFSNQCLTAKNVFQNNAEK